MADMTGPEMTTFLTEGPHGRAPTGKLATVRADGSPHVAPIWFALDGDDWLFTTHATSVKGKALRRDPRVSICVDDDRPPFAFVIVSGRVALSEDPQDLLRWATVIGGRYMGADQAESYGTRNGVPGELLVRLTPTRVIAQTGIAL
jgi:PPOX class probable F420-dependent enzyme